MEQEALEAENALLREFYDSWVFFHSLRVQPAESEAWQESRLRLAAQGMLEAANKVAQHIKRLNTTH